MELSAPNAPVRAGWMGGDVAYRVSHGESWGWDGVSNTLAWGLLVWTAVAGAGAAFLQTNVRTADAPAGDLCGCVCVPLLSRLSNST